MKPYGQVNLPFTGIGSFCKSPIHTDLKTISADVAIFGVPWDEGSGYRPGARFGPKSIREYSARFAFHERGVKEGGFWSIERQKRYLDKIRLVDAGDQDVLYLDVERTFAAVTDSVREILSRKVLPVAMGGDHSISFPVVRAFEELGEKLHVIQLDAHLDYNDSVEGIRLANGSPLKRISELNFIGEIVQIGMRGIRARKDAYDDSRSRGNRIITMSDFRKMGIEGVINQIPQGGKFYVTIDIDALDPSIAPGTTAPCFNGLTYQEMRDLLMGIASRGSIMGFDVVEVNPFLDPVGLTQSAAVMIILEFLGSIFDRR
jgi:agmatinase